MPGQRAILRPPSSCQRVVRYVINCASTKGFMQLGHPRFLTMRFVGSAQLAFIWNT
jgi:hypothetical protein